MGNLIARLQLRSTSTLHVKVVGERDGFEHVCFDECNGRQAHQKATQSSNWMRRWPCLSGELAMSMGPVGPSLLYAKSTMRIGLDLKMGEHVHTRGKYLYVDSI